RRSGHLLRHAVKAKEPRPRRKLASRPHAFRSLAPPFNAEALTNVRGGPRKSALRRGRKSRLPKRSSAALVRAEQACDPMHGIVIGGGIGGMTLAASLERVGISSEVHEQAEGLREVGAGLTLWSNALTALGRLGAA